jgi:hypothetical protein
MNLEFLQLKPLSIISSEALSQLSLHWFEGSILFVAIRPVFASLLLGLQAEKLQELVELEEVQQRMDGVRGWHI